MHSILEEESLAPWKKQYKRRRSVDEKEELTK